LLQFVMPGHCGLLCSDGVNLSAMPGIRLLGCDAKKDVDGRDKPGHDGSVECVD